MSTSRTLLGLGRPSYSAYSNGLKCLFLVVGLPIGVGALGLIGGVTVVTAADAFRYFPILVGQRREQFSYGRQDLLITFAMLSLVTLWEVIRWSFGFGTSFNSLPLRTLFHGSSSEASASRCNVTTASIQRARSFRKTLSIWSIGGWNNASGCVIRQYFQYRDDTN